MKTIKEEKIGKSTLRLLAAGNAISGIVLSDGKIQSRIDGDDPEKVWEMLISEAAKCSPDYFGFDGAINRFQTFFPEGFSSPDYLNTERKYKIEAKELLDRTVPLEAAMNGSGYGEAIKSVFNKTFLLSQFELVRLKDVLHSAKADQFVRGAAMMASGETKVGLREMEQALKLHDVAKWTAVTYLPYLWRPDVHMFLKPEATKDFSERVGHPFFNNYETQIKVEVYDSLLDLVKTTELNVVELDPQDRIDIQSFIWVVGNYDLERDMPDSRK